MRSEQTPCTPPRPWAKQPCLFIYSATFLNPYVALHSGSVTVLGLVFKVVNKHVAAFFYYYHVFMCLFLEMWNDFILLYGNFFYFILLAECKNLTIIKKVSLILRCIKRIEILQKNLCFLCLEWLESKLSHDSVKQT